MIDPREYPRTCRLCGGRAWRHDLLKYGTRSYAHFACFISRKTVEDARRLPDWQRDRLYRFIDGRKPRP